MAKGVTGGTYRPTTRKKRPGVHSKKRNSNHKSSVNYQKKYRGQGK